MVRATNANEQTVLDLFAALSAKDPAAFAVCLDDEVSWTIMLVDMPGAGPHHGREAVTRNVLEAAGGAFRPGDPKVEVASIVSAGDRVMAETRGSGERADGLAYRNLYAWAFEMRGGRVLRAREYMDSLYIAGFLGLTAPATAQG
jgi:ketosteroid isomerase-like protein